MNTYQATLTLTIPAETQHEAAEAADLMAMALSDQLLDFVADGDTDPSLDPILSGTTVQVASISWPVD